MTFQHLAIQCQPQYQLNFLLLFFLALIFFDDDHVLYYQNFRGLIESIMCQCQNPFHQITYYK
jgi:hypothetical protein